MTNSIIAADELSQQIPYISAQDSITVSISDTLEQALFYHPNAGDTLMQQVKAFFIHNAPCYIPKNKVVIPLDVFFILSLVLLICVAVLRVSIAHDENWSFFSKQTSSLSSNKVLFSSLRLIPSILVIVLGYTLFAGYTVGLWYMTSNYILGMTLLAVVVYLAFYYIIMSLSGFVFNWTEQINLYLKKITTFRFISAIGLFPIVFVFNYMNISKIWNLILVVVLICFLLYKGFLYISIFSKKMRWYEIFLYFCTIEILPLAIFVKFCSNQLHRFLTI